MKDIAQPQRAAPRPSTAEAPAALHTPGAWVIDRKQQGYWPYVWRGESGFSVVDHEGDRERALADAHLMVAAPAMLEALIMVRDADEDCRRDALPTIPSAARARIDTAIAKAAGIGS